MSRALPSNKRIGAFVLNTQHAAGVSVSHGDAKKEISRVFRDIRETSVRNRTHVPRLKSSNIA